MKRLIKNLVVVNPVGAKVFTVLRRRSFYVSAVRALARIQGAITRGRKDYCIQIETTNACNAHCIFCPNSKQTRPKSVMSDEMFRLILCRIKEDGIRPYGINLNGTGEPFLDNDIIPRIRAVKEAFPKAIVKIHSNLALPLEPTVLRELVNCRLDEINVSINGYDAASYNAVMGLNYERTKNNLRILVDSRNAAHSKLKIRISLALTHHNEDHVVEFVNEWKGLVDSVTVNRAHDYSKAVPESAGVKGYDGELPAIPCKAVFCSISVGVDGEILRCCLDYDGQKGALGNIKDGLLKHYEGQRFQELRDANLKSELRLPMVCRRCYALRDTGFNWFIRRLI